LQYGLNISSIYAAGLARALTCSRALRFARVKVAARDLYGALRTNRKIVLKL
jgi:hypothetical protein